MRKQIIMVWVVALAVVLALLIIGGSAEAFSFRH